MKLSDFLNEVAELSKQYANDETKIIFVCTECDMATANVDEIAFDVKCNEIVVYLK
jgi:hypothetical protein